MVIYIVLMPAREMVSYYMYLLYVRKNFET